MSNSLLFDHPERESGVYLVLDGVTGNGKTTRIRHLDEELNSLGLETHIVQEQNGSELVNLIYSYLGRFGQLFENIDAGISTLMMCVHAWEDSIKYISPNLDQGDIVLGERSPYSMVIYQPLLENLQKISVGKPFLERAGKYMGFLRNIFNYPDMTLIVDGPYDSFLSRGECRDYTHSKRTYSPDEIELMRESGKAFKDVARSHDGYSLVTSPWRETVDLEQVIKNLDESKGEFQKVFSDGSLEEMRNAEYITDLEMLYFSLLEIRKRYSEGRKIRGYDENKVDQRLGSLLIEIKEARKKRISALVDSSLSGGLSEFTDEISIDFEKAINAYFGSQNSVAVPSGSDAMYLAFASLGLKKGEKVLVPANSLALLIPPLVQLGLDVVAYDTEKNGISIDFTDIEAKIREHCPKAILSVDLFGYLQDYERLQGLKERYGFYIIEDASQAHGSHIREKMAGTLGDVGFLSAQESKLFTMGGGGGIVLTDDKKLAAKMRQIKIYGETDDGILAEGRNLTVPSMMYAAGIGDLEFLNFKVNRLRYVQGELEKALEGQQVFSIYRPEYQSENNFSIILLYNKKNASAGAEEIHELLFENGIKTNYKMFGDKPIGKYRFIGLQGNRHYIHGATPNFNSSYKDIINITVPWDSTDQEIEKITESLVKVAREVRQ